MQAAQFFYKPLEVRQRLAQMDLTPEVLLSSCRQGLLAFALCTPNHPVSYAGSSLWAETVSGLGEQLAPDGWRRIDPGGQPLVLHPKGNLPSR